MPARLIEHEDGMGARRDRRADLGEMRLHRLRCRTQGMTSPAPLPSAGQTAPKM